MPKYQLTCNYCNHKFEKFVYSVVELVETTCPHCKDKNIKVKKEDDTSTDVFGYEYDGAREDAWVKKE